MFGIGSTELLVILVVALLVLGPRNLPKVAQTLGRAMGEFRKVSTEFQRTLNTEIAFEERAEEAREAEKKAKSPKEAAADTSTTGTPPGSSKTNTRPLTAEAAIPDAAPEATPSAPVSAPRTGDAGPEEQA